MQYLPHSILTNRNKIVYSGIAKGLFENMITFFYQNVFYWKCIKIYIF